MAAVSIFVHDLGSRELRVKFGAPVESADNPAAYLLAAAGSEHVPTVTSAAYYDADKMSVVLTLSEALTRFGSYTCAAVNLWSSDGVPVTSTPFAFVAADVDRPVAVGAFLSARGCIDVVFDRDVAQTSGSAEADLVADGVVPMTLVPWVSGRPENSVRFQFGSAPTGPGFEVHFNYVTDVSGNSSSGAIPLTLAHEATSYADLVQARVTAAHLVDVSNSVQFCTAVVRAYFNCPMYASDVANLSKWSVTQQTAHTAADPSNEVTAADAIGEPSLITLLNQIKAKLNAHFVSHAHVSPDSANAVTEVDATDFESAFALLQDEQAVYLQHLARLESHLYADELHLCDAPAPGGLADSIAWANQLKACLNGHVAAEYPVPFSTAYSPIGPVVNFASEANAAPVTDPHTWFADLHLRTSATDARLNVSTIAIRSEDLASSSSDSIDVEPLASPPQVLSTVPLVRGAVVRTAGGLEILDADSIRVFQGSDAVGVRVQTIGSLPAMLWAYNNVLHAYKMHISDPLLDPFVGAGHKVLDTVNTVSIGEYATAMDLGSLISRANALKEKMTAHMTSGVFHYGQDGLLDAPDASDASTLTNLLEELQAHLLRHNSAGFGPNGDTAREAPLYHEFPGVGVMSAPVRDLAVISAGGLLNSAEVSFAVGSAKSWRDNRPTPAGRIVPGEVSGSFSGIDVPPVMTSAVARGGLDHAAPSRFLLSDSIELYMSKPMRHLAVLPGVGVAIPGVSVLDASWLSDRVASVRVVGMSAIPYTVQVTGMRDLAGNPLYEEIIS